MQIMLSCGSLLALNFWALLNRMRMEPQGWEKPRFTHKNETKLQKELQKNIFYIFNFVYNCMKKKNLKFDNCKLPAKFTKLWLHVEYHKNTKFVHF